MVTGSLIEDQPTLQAQFIGDARNAWGSKRYTTFIVRSCFLAFSSDIERQELRPEEVVAELMCMRKLARPTEVVCGVYESFELNRKVKVMGWVWDSTAREWAILAINPGVPLGDYVILDHGMIRLP